MATGFMQPKDDRMSPRAFGLLMLLFCSAMAGAGYVRLSDGPSDRLPVAVADVAAPQPRGQVATVLTNAAPQTRTVRSEPPVRVILPSPYEIRAD